MLAQLEGRQTPCLLLGVTPELAVLPGAIVAIDWSDAMIEQVWPGSTPNRAIVQGDWLDMPFAPGSFGAALGDGSLNMLRWPNEYQVVLDWLGSLVRPGGRIVFRCFTSPDVAEPLEELATRSMAGEVAGFHAFKWRLAMSTAQASGTPNVALRAVWEAFEIHFADRALLSHATGWDLATIAEIDDYALSPLEMSFPTKAQLFGITPHARLVAGHGYELAERCPLLVVDRL